MTTTLDNERFFVEYSDGRGRWEPFTMYWNINDKHITRFWKAKLLENYIGINNRTKYALLDKRYMNRGFLFSKDGKYSRDIQAVCDEVNNAIQILNIEYSQISDYPKIDLKFTPERCWNEDGCFEIWKLKGLPKEVGFQVKVTKMVAVDTWKLQGFEEDSDSDS